MNLPDLRFESDFTSTYSVENTPLNDGVSSDAARQEAARLAAEINLDGYEDAPEVVTACYLCHGQCSNFGVHGKSIRPCAKGVSSILARHRQLRLSRLGNSQVLALP